MKSNNQNIDINKCEQCDNTGVVEIGMYDEVETVKCRCAYMDEQSEWELHGRDDK